MYYQEIMARKRCRINGEKRKQRMAAANRKGTHNKAEWEEMKLFFGGFCVRCKREPGSIVKDHIIPIYQEGSNGMDNLQPLCPRCNAQKGSEDTDWRMRFCEDYGLEMPEKWLPEDDA